MHDKSEAFDKFKEFYFMVAIFFILLFRIFNQMEERNMIITNFKVSLRTVASFIVSLVLTPLPKMDVQRGNIVTLIIFCDDFYFKLLYHSPFGQMLVFLLLI